MAEGARPIFAVVFFLCSALEIFGQTNLTVSSAGFSKGRFTFTVTGPADHSIVIQRSTNLIDWVAASTNALVGGRIEFQEIELTAAQFRFFRAIDSCCPEPPQSITLTSADKSKTFRVSVGAAIDVTLTANPSTGYIWEIANVNSAVMKLTADPTFRPDRPVPGSPGKMTFHFQAISKGESNLKLIYHRPFETTQPPLDTFEATIVVE